THQLINSSTHQLINSSTHQLINSSTHQLINSSTHHLRIAAGSAVCLGFAGIRSTVALRL
ncbi:MAG: hypothetical protein AB7U20_20005, partial [Planctomycetaceae bacterium]